MRYLVYTILILILLAFNSQIEYLFYGTPIRLNLLSLLVIFAAMEKRDVAFLFIAFICGLILDFYATAPFGTFLFSFIITGAFLNWSVKTFWLSDLNFKFTSLFLVIGLLTVEIFIRVFAESLPHSAFPSAFEFKESALKILSGTIFGLLSAWPIFAVWRFALKFISGMESKRLILK